MTGPARGVGPLAYTAAGDSAGRPAPMVADEDCAPPAQLARVSWPTTAPRGLGGQLPLPADSGEDHGAATRSGRALASDASNRLQAPHATARGAGRALEEAGN